MPGLGRTTDDNCNLSSAGNHGDRTIPGFGGRRNCMSDGYGLRVPQTAASGPVSRPGLTWYRGRGRSGPSHSPAHGPGPRAHTRVRVCLSASSPAVRVFVPRCVSLGAYNLTRRGDSDGSGSRTRPAPLFTILFHSAQDRARARTIAHERAREPNPRRGMSTRLASASAMPRGGYFPQGRRSRRPDTRSLLTLPL